MKKIKVSEKVKNVIDTTVTGAAVAVVGGVSYVFTSRFGKAILKKPNGFWGRLTDISAAVTFLNPMTLYTALTSNFFEVVDEEETE